MEKSTKSTTERGFALISFKDYFNVECSLQKSSLATHNAIWLGVNDTEFTIFEDKNMGKYIRTKLPPNFSVNTRMHLTQVQVKELLPLLQKFAETGEL